ncbi:MAG: glycosyltransferase [Candidatus Eisenbacteria bacterium]
MNRVCFFGAYDPAYPRNRILREGARRAGLGVIEARVPEKRAFRRWPALAAAFARVARAADVVFVPEFRHKDVPLAALLRGRRPLVFDPLVSRWDTLVGDWKLHGEGSSQARWNRFLDRWSLSLADRVLCDTWAHGELFESLGVPKAKLHRVLVGAEDAFFEVPPPPAAGAVCVLYLGGFLPLHGTRTMIEAAAILESRGTALPPWTLQMVGRGIECDAAKALAESRGLVNVAFPGALPYADAPRVFAQAHVVLGAFGAGEKTGRVVPHKLWQGLATGRAVVTGDGPGPREVLEPGRDAVLVPRADAEALAEALQALLLDPARRATLGAAGRARALEIATPDAVGRSFAAALEGLAS